MITITSLGDLVDVSRGVQEDLLNPEAATGPRMDAMLRYLHKAGFRTVDENVTEITEALRNLGAARGLRMTNWLLSHPDEDSGKAALVWQKIHATLEAERNATEALTAASA